MVTARALLLLSIQLSFVSSIRPATRLTPRQRTRVVTTAPSTLSKWALLVTPRNLAPSRAKSSPPRIITPPPAPEQAGVPVNSATRYDAEYWYHPNIHNWGNIGPGGWFHAFWAPTATAIIDRTSYSGMDVRKAVFEKYVPSTASVLDLCCGTGFSTARTAGRKVFGVDTGRRVVGVDTSPAMLRMARFLRPGATFVKGNAESYGEDGCADVVTVMFAMHEMPLAGRRRVLRNAMRLARRSVVVVDIDPDFQETLRQKPMEGATFLSGEPYVLEYLANMDKDVYQCASRAPVRLAAPATTWRVTRDRLLPKHVVVWHLERGS